mmetsp:Transcript_43411/g.94272  ORF Transcript_43411/g.94272 Transcript_43411/m.94272 type:complete len:278 (+) Transcript_43411:98-931(+)
MALTLRRHAERGLHARKHDRGLCNIALLGGGLGRVGVHLCGGGKTGSSKRAANTPSAASNRDGTFVRQRFTNNLGVFIPRCDVGHLLDGSDDGTVPFWLGAVRIGHKVEAVRDLAPLRTRFAVTGEERRSKLGVVRVRCLVQIGVHEDAGGAPDVTGCAVDRLSRLLAPRRLGFETTIRVNGLGCPAMNLFVAPRADAGQDEKVELFVGEARHVLLCKEERAHDTTGLVAVDTASHKDHAVAWIPVSRTNPKQRELCTAEFTVIQLAVLEHVVLLEA